MSNLIKKIYFVVQVNSTRNLFYIFLITIIGTLLELLSIGLIIPILNIAVGNDYQKNIITFNFLSTFSKTEVLNFLIVFLAFIYFFKFFFIKNLINRQNSFSHNLFASISKILFRKYLYKDFEFHLNINSSELIRNIQGETNLFSFGVVFNLIRLFSEIIIFTSICVLLLFYEWQASIIVMLLVLGINYILLKHNNKKLKELGVKRQFHSALTLKQLQQSFSSIKEIIINKLENIFINKFNYHLIENVDVGIKKDTITQLPRLIMELVGILVFLILIIFFLNTGKDISEIFVIVGVFLFASTKLLPSVSKIAQSIQSIKFNSAVVDLIFNELNEQKYNEKINNKINQANLIFNNIKFDKVDFYFTSRSNEILRNINFEINKGDRIGIIGKTGSGKSTLINLFCGLLSPKSGKILLNNKDLNFERYLWQTIISYVPQNVSIIDESILFNICLDDDKNKIDLKKVDKILKTVDLYDYIYSLPMKLDQLAGELGKNLSGGQCQRIGIARALYKNTKILVLDEATNALDFDTETSILKKIFNEIEDITILMISHKNKSLTFCNRIVEIKEKTLKEIKVNK